VTITTQYYITPERSRMYTAININWTL